MPIIYDQPTPDTIVTATGQRLTIDQAAQRVGVEHILHRFGVWAVTEFGIESVADRYLVPIGCLDDPSWCTLMAAKRWGTVADARAAWETARAVHGVAQTKGGEA